MRGSKPDIMESDVHTVIYVYNKVMRELNHGHTYEEINEMKRIIREDTYQMKVYVKVAKNALENLINYKERYIPNIRERIRNGEDPVKIE